MKVAKVLIYCILGIILGCQNSNDNKDNNDSILNMEIFVHLDQVETAYEKCLNYSVESPSNDSLLVKCQEEINSIRIILNKDLDNLSKQLKNNQITPPEYSQIMEKVNERMSKIRELHLKLKGKVPSDNHDTPDAQSIPTKK